jgi:hypothetical protein
MPDPGAIDHRSPICLSAGSVQYGRRRARRGRGPGGLRGRGTGGGILDRAGMVGTVKAEGPWGPARARGIYVARSGRHVVLCEKSPGWSRTTNRLSPGHVVPPAQFVGHQIRHPHAQGVEAERPAGVLCQLDAFGGGALQGALDAIDGRIEVALDDLQS